MALNVGTLYQELELDDRKWKSGLASVASDARAAGNKAGNAFDDGMEQGVRRNSAGRLIDQQGRYIARSAEKNAGKVKRSYSNAMSGIGGMMAGIGGMYLGKQMVEGASALNESINAVTVSYGKNAEAVLAIGDGAADSMGLARREFNASAVQMSAFAKDIAGPGGDVVGTLDDLMMRATDFGSVMNLETSDALERFQSGLAGEIEPLKKFGIKLSDGAMNAYLLEKGIDRTTTTMTEQEKVQLRYQMIMDQTNKMEGDFANTKDGFANSTKIATATTKNASDALTTDLLPALARGARLVNKFASIFESMPGPLQNATIGLAAFVMLAPKLAAVKSLAGGLPGRFNRTTTAINGSTAALEGQTAAAATAKGKWAALGKSIGVAALAYTAFQGAQAIGDSGDVGKWAAANGSGGSWWSDALNESSIGAQNLVDRVTGVELPGLKASREAYNAQEAARKQQQKANEIAQWKIAHPKQARKMMRKSRRAGNPSVGEGKGVNVQNMNVYASNPDQLAKQMRRKAKHNALRGGN